VVDVAMLDSLASLVLDEPLDLQVAAGQSPRTGNRRPRLTPFAAYEAADGFIAICAVTDAQVADLFRAMGRDDLVGDARYATLEARVGRAACSARQRSARIPAGPVADVADLLANPQLQHRAMITPVEHPEGGAVPGAHAADLPIRFSRAEARLDRPAPLLGADNARVYGELLGLGAERLADLAARGVI
jgi:CoA:oxalate CoA-transferase